jgi:hypothetical protein
MLKKSCRFWMFVFPLLCVFLFPAPAMAEKTCPWLKQILADRENEFMAFKGEQQESVLSGTSPLRFKGTLELNVTGKAKAQGCYILVRRTLAEKEIAPSYTCTIAWKAAFEQAKADYELIGRKLRECLPIEFTEEHTGDVEKLTAGWVLTGILDGAKIQLAFADLGSFSGTGTSRALVDLTVLHELPMRPGLSIDIPVIQ